MLLNEMQKRLLRYESFLSLGFGNIDSAKLISIGARGVGRVSYYSFGYTV